MSAPVEERRVAIGEIRANLGEYVTEVKYTGGRTIITKNGKDMAVLISTDELALLDEIELQADSEAFRQAQASDDGSRIPFDQAVEEIEAGLLG